RNGTATSEFPEHKPELFAPEHAGTGHPSHGSGTGNGDRQSAGAPVAAWVLADPSRGGTIIRSDRHPVGTPVTALGGGTYGVTQNGLFAQYALIPLIAGDKRILGYSVHDEPATWVR